MVEDSFNRPDRANELYLWGLLQARWVMAKFVKEKFAGNTKFQNPMFMLILYTMVPKVDIEGVYDSCANVSALPLTVQNHALSVGAFYSRLRALEATVGLEVGGGTALSTNSSRNKNRQSGTNGSGGNDVGDIVYIP